MTHGEWSRISRVATMLRAQELAITFEGDDSSGWAAAIIRAAQPNGTGIVGYGGSRAEAAEGDWKRRTAQDTGDRPWIRRSHRSRTRHNTSTPSPAKTITARPLATTTRRT